MNAEPVVALRDETDHDAERRLVDHAARVGPNWAKEPTSIVSVAFGDADSAYDANSPQTTAVRIGAPAPTVIPGAQHLTSVNSPADVAAAIEGLAARAGR